MNKELSDILSNNNKDIDSRKLMDYLSNDLSTEDKHELEEAMVDSPFLSDALDGLKSFKSEESLTEFVQQLNSHLKKQLELKKKRRLKRKLKDQPWAVISIVLILLLVVICFLVIRKHLGAS